MDKPFKYLHEQIKILENRKIIIDDKEYVRDYLLRNNYYNIINGYGKFFMPNDIAIENTNFKEIVAAHLFDADLKSAYFKYIIIIENCFKSVVSYVFSKYNQNEEDFYLNINNYYIDPTLKIKDVNKYKYEQEKIVKMVNIFNKIITKYQKISKHPISHYKRKYDNLPLWVVINYFTFGQVLELFNFLPPKIKNNVAKELNIIANRNMSTTSIKLTYEQYYQILSNILSLRNSSAHDDSLLHFYTSYSYPYVPCIHDTLDIKANCSKNTLYQTHIMMQLFITHGQYINLCNLINKAFINLDKKIFVINTEVITYTTGFPCSWIDKIYIQDDNKQNIFNKIKNFLIKSK